MFAALGPSCAIHTLGCDLHVVFRCVVNDVIFPAVRRAESLKWLVVDEEDWSCWDMQPQQIKALQAILRARAGDLRYNHDE